MICSSCHGYTELGSWSILGRAKWSSIYIGRFNVYLNCLVYSYEGYGVILCIGICVCGGGGGCVLFILCSCAVCTSLCVCVCTYNVMSPCSCCVNGMRADAVHM